jgi:hypothetical protein
LFPVCPSLLLSGVALIASLSWIIPAVGRGARVDITSAEYHKTQQGEQSAADFHGSSIYHCLLTGIMTAKTVPSDHGKIKKGTDLIGTPSSAMTA